MNKKNSPDLTTDIAHMSYEEARSQLVDIVTRLEQGSIPLEESLSLWNMGEQLADRCEQLLAGAQKQLDNARTDKKRNNTAEENAHSDDTRDLATSSQANTPHSDPNSDTDKTSSTLIGENRRGSVNVGHTSKGAHS